VRGPSNRLALAVYGDIAGELQDVLAEVSIIHDHVCTLQTGGEPPAVPCAVMHCLCMFEHWPLGVAFIHMA
jgi:hypothetical protein